MEGLFQFKFQLKQMRRHLADRVARQVFKLKLNDLDLFLEPVDDLTKLLGEDVLRLGRGRAVEHESSFSHLLFKS